MEEEERNSKREEIEEIEEEEEVTENEEIEIEKKKMEEVKTKYEIEFKKLYSIDVEKVFESAKKSILSLTSGEFETPSPTNKNRKGDNWDWNDEDSQDEKKKKQKPSFEKSDIQETNAQKWFKQCSAGISWDLKCLVLAQRESLVFIKLDSFETNKKTKESSSTKEKKTKNSISSNNSDLNIITPQHCDKGDTVTAICIFSLSTFSSPAPKYICVAVGYQSGYVRIFNENGIEIFTQFLHNTSVHKIKLRTAPITEGPLGKQKEDLCILYQGSVIIFIDGYNLSSLLQTSLSQVERGSKLNENSILNYKKFELGGQSITNDVITISITATSPFGLLHSLPTESKILAVGKEPMIAFYISPLSEFGFFRAITLVSNVASKLGEAVFSFAKSWSPWNSNSSVQLYKKSESEKKKEEPVEKPVFTKMKWSINDPTRNIQTVSVDPFGIRAVLTDGFGRVLLLSLLENTIIRMWKGYRDAQCGWIQISNDKNLNSSFTLFLIIYAQRRGLLEVWNIEDGTRQLFKNVGLGCQILYSPTPLGDTSSQSKLSKCFILYKDGTLEQILVKNSE